MRIGRSGGRAQSRPPDACMASLSTHDVHVVPHSDGWAVERDWRPTGVYFARRFAVSAGREMARRDCVELLVFDGQRELDFRESYRATEPDSERRWRTK